MHKQIAPMHSNLDADTAVVLKTVLIRSSGRGLFEKSLSQGQVRGGKRKKKSNACECMYINRSMYGLEKNYIKVLQLLLLLFGGR